MFSSSALPTTPPSLLNPSLLNSSITIRLHHDAEVHCELTSLTLLNPDVTPPAVHSVTANPSVLWPPNGKLVAVTVVAAITDDQSGVASATLIIDDEYNEFDREVPLTLNAATGLWAATVPLRADRNGNDKTDGGRIYQLNVQATDAAGNVSDPNAMGTQVLVPHDQGKGNGKK